MARVPNEKAEKAKELYDKGMKLIDIANELDAPPGTVRRWKSTYKWDNVQNERSGEKVERSTKKNERSVKRSKKCKESTEEKVKKEVEKALKNTELNDKQRMFCLHYVRTFNATQSYIKAYGGSYNNAMVSGCKLLRNPKIKAELDELKRMKMECLMFSEEDLVEYHMRIAFSDMGDYVSFGQKEIKKTTKNGVPLVDDDGNEITVKVNEVNLKESDQVDTQLIKEVTEGRNGISIKLVDKSKSFDWLDKYFLVHPMDKHKIDYDNRKLALMNKNDDEEEEIADDGFLEALNESAKDDWNEE